jgi:hypothetical protein
MEANGNIQSETLNVKGGGGDKRHMQCSKDHAIGSPRWRVML